jgi:hypothetical protein
MKLIGLAIALVQLSDLLLHAASNQLEPLRVTSNLVILLWLAIAASGRLNTRLQLAALVSIGAYLLLNLVFLAREGLTNPAQGGALRVALFGLMFFTVALSGLFIYLREK